MEAVTRTYLLLSGTSIQLNVCKLEYGDFVLWTENGLAIERIICDTAFYEHVVTSVQHLFTYGILPEVVGK